MNDPKIELINSMYFETELLEALDWDEDKLKIVCQKTSEYFSVCTKTDLDLIKIDLGFIFSEEVANIISKHVKIKLQELGENNET